MSWTKLQFIQQAFNEIGLASYEFDQQPEQYEFALQRLDSMMATWNAEGIRIGYPLPSNPEESSLSELTMVPDAANEAIYTNLAIRIAPSYGKVVSNETKMAAKEAYTALKARFQVTPIMQYPGTMPAGAGSKWWRFSYQPFLRRPLSPIQDGPDGYIEMNFQNEGNQSE